MSRQDSENFAPKRIELLAQLATKLGYTQVILFAHAQECGTVVTTWGVDAERSDQAAEGANKIKSSWNWPEDTLVESAKVTALRERIKVLEAELLDARWPTMAWVVEETEHERGWGQRPDGYSVFLTEEQAEAFIAEKTEGRQLPTPDVYVSYSLLGSRPISLAFGRRLREIGEIGIWVSRLSELTS